MSIKQLVKRYGIGIAIVIALYILFSNVAKSIPALSQVIGWLVNAVIIPITVLLAIKFVGDMMMERSTSLKHPKLSVVTYVTGAITTDLLGPAIFAYLFLSTTASMLPHTGIYAKADLIANAVFLITLGALTSHLGNRFGEAVKPFLKYLGIAVILLGLSSVFAQVYPPMASLLEYPGIAALAISLALLTGLSKSLGAVYIEARNLSRYVMIIFVILGIMAFISSIPQLAAYSGYVITASLIIIMITMLSIGYRMYKTYSQASSKIMEKIYQQHAFEAELMVASDDTEFTNAVKNFLINGRKEELIAYASYALSQCMDEFTKVRESITDLLNYEPPRRVGVWPWEENIENINKEIERRKEITNKVINILKNCQTKAEPNPH